MKMKPMLWLSALALLPATAVPMLGQPLPVGAEFRVNANTESKQHNPVAAFNAAGSALVVWENDKNGLRGRFYGRDGSPLTDELGHRELVEVRSGSQRQPVAAGLHHVRCQPRWSSQQHTG